MKYYHFFIIVFGIVGFLSCKQQNEVPGSKEGVFVVSYPYGYTEPTESVYLSLTDLEQNYGLSDFTHTKLVSMNNHQQVPFNLVDSDGDTKPDLLHFNLEINAKEPLRPFRFESVATKQEINPESIDSFTNRVKTTYLHSAKQYKTDSIAWRSTVANTFMELYPEACNLEAFSPNKWTYTNGFFTNALCELYKQTQNDAYVAYAKKWIDCFVAADGSIPEYDQEKYRLDDILPARTLLYLYEEYGEEKYKTAADNFIHQIENQPRNADGGYWHKSVYPYQMWLDGIYMGDVYTAQYAKMFKQPELFNEAIHQIKLIYQHTCDSVSGLMYHGYDASINDVWSDPVRGTSPEFWGRGMGWFMMALVDVLEYLPDNHPEKDNLKRILTKTSEALAKVQDPDLHLWYQVLDKGSYSDNWIETSCSAMFAYAFAKGASLGYLPQEFKQKANLAFTSLLNQYVFFDSDGRFYLTETVYVGTLNFNNSDGSYNYYIHTDRRINDFKGVAAFLYLAMALEK